MDTHLVGLWAFSKNAESTDEWFLEVFPDGRLAQFYKQHPAMERYVAMTMRGVHLGEDRFQIKTKQDVDGYPIAMKRDGANLVIINKGVRFVCRPQYRLYENHLRTPQSRCDLSAGG